ncbi:fungal-specific transcription factor domain-containing protein [Coniochaeta sp. 2T2.1]|nr:fungal-specific transcription factor domain-containing protein [Coniochaeta sp. 2T2.1]
MGSGPYPESSDDEDSSLEATSPGGGAKPSGAVIKTDPEDSGTGDGQSGTGGTSMPVQKRRRVTRACDECRRKKIKCDGKQPCTHCSVYSYECTYDKPSNRRRNPAPQYIEALETRLQRAEDLLRKFMPDVNLADPGLDPTVQQEFHNRDKARTQAAKLKREAMQRAATEAQDPQLQSMIETIGQLDLSEDGEWDFHGTSSGAVFLRRMKQHFRGLLGNDYRTPFLPRPLNRPQGMFSIESPRSSSSSPWDVASMPNLYDLPDKEKARTLCYYSLNCATCLMRVVHIPWFYEMFEKVYELPPEGFGNEERRFLGLLYSVLALGCMYNVSADDPSRPVTYKTAMEEGINYYTSARVLIQDVAECRDLTSLQALLYMLLFLQVTANISGCYSFVGIALRSAIRMGLHRRLPHAKLTPIEDESRKRAFFVIRQMDTYISAILGFPMMLSHEDIDQALPTEVDDEYITKDAILTPPSGTPSFFQAFNAQARLMEILEKVVRHIYPIKGMEESIRKKEESTNATYVINYGRIREIEQDLQDWYDRLPEYWRPSPEGPIEVIRVRTLLRFAYAHVQMMLYRPFLHYASPKMAGGKPADERCYACAAAAITVSRNIVHIGIEIQKQAHLIGPYWFALYTQFFAIISLVFYVLENPDKPGATEILEDAREGTEVIASLSQRSIAAERITDALSSLFEQLPERLRQIKGRPIPSKKRSASSAKSSLANRIASDSAVKSQRRSDELSRSSSSQIRTSGEHAPIRPPHRTSSFDIAHMQQQHSQSNLSTHSFSTSFPDLLPMDMSSTAGDSEGSSTPGGMGQPSSSAQNPNLLRLQSQQGGGGGNSALYKLDAMMFPTGDPFAYPNQQPLMDFPAVPSPQTRQTPNDSSMAFYMPHLYDDIEGQLLGPLPPYLQQQQQQQGQHPGAGQGSHGGGGGGGGLDINSQVYNAAGMMGMPNIQQGGGNGGGMTAQQRHQREIDAMLADPSFRGDWGDLLGGGGYRHL